MNFEKHSSYGHFCEITDYGKIYYDNPDEYIEDNIKYYKKHYYKKTEKTKKSCSCKETPIRQAHIDNCFIEDEQNIVVLSKRKWYNWVFVCLTS